MIPVAIFLVSAAALLFQVAQTRLFSAALGYHLAFLVISVALLGVGAGATAAALLDRDRTRQPSGPLAAATGASVLLALFVETRVDPIAHGIVSAIAVAYFFGALPYVFTSWLVVRALRYRPDRSGLFYAADLAGAAAGGLLGYAALRPLGAQGLHGLAAGLAFSGAGLLLGNASVRVRLAARVMLALVAVVSVAALSLAGEGLAPPRVSADKDAALAAHGRSVEVVAWDPLARVDVFRFPDEVAGRPYAFLVAKDYLGPWPNARSLRLDLDAHTPILDARSEDALEPIRASVLRAPYELLERPSVLVIGAGGGIDVLAALAANATSVTAVEVNRTIVELMRTRYAAYSGHLFSRPGVTVVEDEARSYVRRSTDRYDLIVMTVVDSWAALANGWYALAENYLYTEEAFADYLAHLTPSGLVSVGRWYREPPVEMLRTAQIAAGGMRRNGIRAPERQAIVLRHEYFGLLLAAARPFGVEEVTKIRRFAAEHGFELAYDPLTPSEPFASALRDDAIVPATDDRPFFFMSVPLTSVLFGQDDLPIGYATLFLALILAAVLAYLVVLLPLRLRPAMGRLRGHRSATGYALAIGLGFMAAEIVLLQRLTLYLGQPALALSVTLGALLAGAAAGSALSRRIAGGVRVAVVTSAAGLTLILAVLPLAMNATLSWELPARIGLAIVASFLVGAPLGTAFPRLVAAVGREQPQLVSWVWAVNGSASVVGAILAVGVAMTFGFTVLGGIAVSCYALAALARVPRAELERVRSTR